MRNSWAAEHPIGNPVIDGRLHEPVSATFAAIAAGTATAATVMAGIGMIGTALSVVGMVTGNAGLAKIGGAMGLVGGIGGLAANAFSGAGAAVGEGMASGAMAEGATATAGQTIGDNVAASLSTGAQAADGVAGSFGNMLADTGAAAGSSLAGEAGSLLGPSALENSIDSGILGGANNNLAGAAGSIEGVSASVPGAEMYGYDPFAAPSTAGANPAGSASLNSLNTGATPAGSKGILGDVSGFFKDNKELLKIGGDMIKGGSEQQTAKDLMKMRSEYQMALQNNDFAHADELRRQYNASVAGTKINMTSNPGAQVNPSGMSLARTSGIIPRAWNGGAA